VGKSEGKHLWEHSCVDERIVLIWIFKNWDGDMEWTDPSQDRDRWRAFVFAAVNLLFL
jgi:hypothetical protein